MRAGSPGEVERKAQEWLAQVDDDPTAVLDDLDLSESDRAVLNDRNVRETFRAATREMFAHGALGWVDDDLAFTKP